QFVQDITAWAFKESLILKVESATHYLASDATHTQKDQYTINDQLVFDLELSKYNPSSGKYEPYSAIEDMQLEFTMLDPHIRTDLKPAKGTPGKYSLQFRAPDRHGVYKFVVNHKRKGFSSVEASLQVAIVPPRHDGYPRFLSSAWPYYVGSISTSVGFIFFCIVYLGGESQERRLRNAKSKSE
ncbi:oligosaccharyl transferase glycoprotein complex, beta subunit, partial [Tulasnella sp. 418]